MRSEYHPGPPTRDRWRFEWRLERLTARRCGFRAVPECAALQATGGLRALAGTSRERLLWALRDAAEYRRRGDLRVARLKLIAAMAINDCNAGGWLP